MITDAILDVAFGAIEWLVGLLPLVTFDSTVFDTVSGWLSWVGCYVDLTTWGIVAGVILGLETLILGVQVLVWLWERLPLT